jgi:predicted heme/steroid binding protein
MPSKAELLKPPPRKPGLPVYSYEDLSQNKSGTKIWVSCKGNIYDVSDKDVYQAGGNYQVFAGRDASCALAKMNFGDDFMNPKLNHWKKNLSQEELVVLDEWVKYYDQRYKLIGYLYDDDVDGGWNNKSKHN